MQGVVIWYSKADFQAIIWCEDSKELGIVSGPTAWRNPMSMVEVGDVVAFRLDPSNSERRCSDVHVLAPAVAPYLHTSIQQSHHIPPPPNRNRLLHLCVSHD